MRSAWSHGSRRDQQTDRRRCRNITHSFTEMPRTNWEYMVLDVGVSGFWTGPDLDGDALTAKLNDLGAAGWEAIGLTGMNLGQGRTKDLIVVLKRPRG